MTFVMLTRHGTCCAQVGKGHIVYTLYVGKDRKMAIQHRADINAPKTPAPTFTMSDLTKTVINLTSKKHTISCVTRDMTYKLFEGDKKDPTPLLPNILDPAGVTAVLVVLDEVHQIYRHSHFCEAMDKMRQSHPEILWAVMGISSTPELDTVSARKNAMTLFGGNKLPEYAMYPPDEFESLKVKMQTLPAKPHANDFKVIDLPTPVGDKEYREEMKLLHQSIINLMMAHPDEKKIAHNAMRDQLNTIMAMQVHDTDGGLLIKEVCKKRDEPRLIKVDNDTPETEPKESVLICYKYDKAARKHMTMLNELIDKNVAVTPPLWVIDLGVEISAEHKEALSDACKAMSASFNLQSCTTVGFAGWKQHDGHDDFSKIGSTVVAIGYDWSPSELNQWGARASRPFTKLTSDEIVPASYEAILFDSPWAKRVNAIDDSKRSRTLNLGGYSDIVSALESLEADAKLSSNEVLDIKIPVKKLLMADEFMDTKGKLAKSYIDALRSFYIPAEKAEEDSADEEEGEEEDEEEGEEEDEEEGEDEDSD